MSEKAKSFQGLTIEQIKRSENRRAEALSKLEAMTYSHFSKKVRGEILNNRSIDVDTITTKEK